MHFPTLIVLFLFLSILVLSLFSSVLPLFPSSFHSFFPSSFFFSSFPQSFSAFYLSFSLPFFHSSFLPFILPSSLLSFFHSLFISLLLFSIIFISLFPLLFLSSFIHSFYPSFFNSFPISLFLSFFPSFLVPSFIPFSSFLVSPPLILLSSFSRSFLLTHDTLNSFPHCVNVLPVTSSSVHAPQFFFTLHNHHFLIVTLPCTVLSFEHNYFTITPGLSADAVSRAVTARRPLFGRTGCTTLCPSISTTAGPFLGAVSASHPGTPPSSAMLQNSTTPRALQKVSTTGASPVARAGSMTATKLRS